MSLSSVRPADFDTYWAKVDSELAGLPVAAELTRLPLQSNEYSTVYAARFTSIGPYRLYAWFSVPVGDGPFPAVYQTPGYGSVVHVPAYELRQRYAVLTLRHRGQRLSDQPYAAAYPGLLTDGIDDPATYIYRGIVADCLRGMDFLLSRPEVDTQHIALTGNDLALITAALRPQASALHCSPGLLYNGATLAPQTSAYPLEEINDYTRAYPDRAAALAHTLGYFNPLHFADRVGCKTLLVTGNDRDFFSPAVLQPLADGLAGPVTAYQTAHSSYRDGVQQAEWLSSHFGYSDTLLPAQWQA
ncbi:MAG: acetylxylan esterase [Caldilineaceae bacterium]|nr:acetylxylan esterase [Caldilineaceae bacterium]